MRVTESHSRVRIRIVFSDCTLYDLYHLTLSIPRQNHIIFLSWFLHFPSTALQKWRERRDQTRIGKIHQFNAYQSPTMRCVPEMRDWTCLPGTHKLMGRKGWPSGVLLGDVKQTHGVSDEAMRPWGREGAVQVSTAWAVPLCGSNLWAESFLTRGKACRCVGRGVLGRRFCAEAWGGGRLGPIMNRKPVGVAGTQWVTPGISWRVGIS